MKRRIYSIGLRITCLKLEDSFSNPGKEDGKYQHAKRGKVQDLPGLPYIF